jgi:protein TonB
MSFPAALRVNELSGRYISQGGLHAIADLAVVWALLNGLQIHNAPPSHAADIVADVIDAPPPLADIRPPEARPSEIKFIPPEVPPVTLTTDVDPVLTVKGDEPPTLPVIDTLPSGTADPQPVITAAAVDPRHPLTQPAYPMSARRGDEQGIALLDILVGTDGRVRDAKVSQSSGFEPLDQAALSAAKQHWRLRPATRNGVAFEQWLTLRVVFRLTDR